MTPVSVLHAIWRPDWPPDHLYFRSLLVAARLHRQQLAAAQHRATALGGAIWVVPSPEPEAPSPFDFRHGQALAAAAYRHTRAWLEVSDRVTGPALEAELDGVPTGADLAAEAGGEEMASQGGSA